MSSGKNFFSEAKALFELPFSSAAAIPLPPPSLYLQLVPVKDRELFRAYIFYLFLLLRRGMRRRGLHPKSFNLLYRAVSRTWPGRTLLGFLQKEFIARNLSLSLLLEPLDGFEWLSKNRYPLEFSAASPIWLQVISPFSRLVAVLNNQTPPFYQPFAALAFVYAAVYVLAVPSAAVALEGARVSVDAACLRRSLPLQQKEMLQLFAAASGFLFRLKTGFFCRSVPPPDTAFARCLRFRRSNRRFFVRSLLSGLRRSRFSGDSWFFRLRLMPENKFFCLC